MKTDYFFSRLWPLQMRRTFIWGKAKVEEIENAEQVVFTHTCLDTRPLSLQLCEKYALRTIFGGGGTMVGNA